MSIAVINRRRLDYTAAVIARRYEGKLQFLLMKTRKLMRRNIGPEIWQFPGGGEEIVDQGNPLRTLNGELSEETGLSLRGDSPDPQLLLSLRSGDHIKRFYLVLEEDLEGQLRAKPIRDGDKRLGVPEWKSVEFLKKNLCRSHRGVLSQLIDFDRRHKGLR